jgi:hypothetical protein
VSGNISIQFIAKKIKNVMLMAFPAFYIIFFLARSLALSLISAMFVCAVERVLNLP